MTTCGLYIMVVQRKHERHKEGDVIKVSRCHHHQIYFVSAIVIEVYDNTTNYAKFNKIVTNHYIGAQGLSASRLLTLKRWIDSGEVFYKILIDDSQLLVVYDEFDGGYVTQLKMKT